MGADLYIPPLRKPVEAVWKPKFDEAVALRNAAEKNGDTIGADAAQKLVDEAYEHLWGGDHYFRDSYNSTSVLWCLGLSWWRDVEFDPPPTDENEEREINVSPALCRKFLDKIEAAQLRLPSRAELERKNAKVEDAGENSIESWHKFYVEKRERLISFLKRAIEHGGMYASC